ncbi:MAG: VWA domain-containing protein [Steroidobacteraceae bacterium]
MFHFAWPWMALFAPLPWLLRRILPRSEPRGAALYLPMAIEVAGAGTGTPRTSRADGALLSVIWALLVLAAMRPQWLGAPIPIHTEGRQIILAIDCSGSMATQDMGGHESRLQVVQQVAGRFIDHSQGDQVGLILFGTRPYLQAPLTTDLRTVHRFLDEAMVGVAGPETAIGDAIGLAIKTLRQVDHGMHTPHQPVMILLTDGGNNTGVMPPIEAAHLAAQTGLRIDTIGVGAAVHRTLFGFSGNTALNTKLLKRIARITGGRYFRATNRGALRAVYRQIDRLDPVAANRQWLRPATEWFALPLALALLLSVPAAWRMTERV